MTKPKTDVDYVVLYAKRLKEDGSLFKKQKILIESQMKSSKEIFKNRFGMGKEFLTNARVYLKRLEMI